MSGIILLPTLNRTKLVKQFFASYEATHAEVPGILLVDEHDFDNNQTAYEEIIKLLPSNWELKETGNAVSMGDKIRFIWPELSGYLWIGLLNDDHFCVTEEWDKKVEGMLDGTNMVSTNDGNWNFGVRVVGLTAWSKPLLDCAGFPIFPRNLQHLYIDDVWKAIGEATGCWRETNKINIEHRHVFFHKMAKDETFEKVYAQPSWEYDSKEFKHFMEQDFNKVVERVKALRADETLKGSFL